MTDPEVLAEIDAILNPIKAANPGITNGEVAELLPQWLRQAFWERALEQALEAELDELGRAAEQ